jgi:glutaredoxin
VTRQVVVYTAEGCSLCASALEVVRAARAELGFELRVVDIGGAPELEAQYRERLPVVEINGEPTFELFVEPHALRARLAE